MATHYLRNAGNTIVDVDATSGDLCSVVIIDEYSKFLLNTSYPQAELIADFHALQELRGEYWEKPVPGESPDELASRRLREIADKYRLGYVTD